MLLIYLSLLFYQRQGNDDDEDDDVISRLFDKLLFPSCISQGCYEFISKRCWKCDSCSRTTAGIVHTLWPIMYIAFTGVCVCVYVGWGRGLGGTWVNIFWDVLLASQSPCRPHLNYFWLFGNNLLTANPPKFKSPTYQDFLTTKILKICDFVLSLY